MPNTYTSYPLKKIMATTFLGITCGALAVNVNLPDNFTSNDINPKAALHRFLSDIKPDNIEQEITLECASTYTKISKSVSMYSKNSDLSIKLIRLFAEDDAEEDYFPSIDFINDEIAKNAECVEIIQSAFRFQDYTFAKKVIKSVMFSDIDYLDLWFKNLLLEGQNVDHVKTYADDVYQMYEEVYDKL